MRRTKEQAAETRRQILRSAEEEFLTRGYENAKLEDIAAAAGVTRGAVHWHFKSKQGLLFALRDESKQVFIELAERLAREEADQPLDALADLICGEFARWSADPRHREMMRVMFYLDLTTICTKEHDPFREALLGAIGKVLELAEQRHGLPSPWTVQSATSIMHGIIEGLLMGWCREDAAFDLVHHGAAVIRTLLASWKR